MYVRHASASGDDDERAWFHFRGGSALLARRSRWTDAVDASWAAGGGGEEALLWEAHGLAPRAAPRPHPPLRSLRGISRESCSESNLEQEL
jgi:hypothetical protein